MNSTTTKNKRNTDDDPDDGDDTATGYKYDDNDDDTSTRESKPLVWTEIDDKLARDKTSHAIRYACKQLKKGPPQQQNEREGRARAAITTPPPSAIPQHSSKRMMDMDETNSVHSSSTASTATVTSTTNQIHRNQGNSNLNNNNNNNYNNNNNNNINNNNMGGLMFPPNMQAGTFLNPITMSHSQPELAPLLQGMGLTNFNQPIYLIVVIPPATNSPNDLANGSDNNNRIIPGGSRIPDVIPSFPSESSVERIRNSMNDQGGRYQNPESTYGNDYENNNNDQTNFVPRIVSECSRSRQSSSGMNARGRGRSSSDSDNDDGNDNEMENENGEEHDDEDDEKVNDTDGKQATRKRKYVTEPSEHDVLLGRGSRINFHPGNVFFRNVIKGSLGREYHRTDTTREEKTSISVQLVHEVQNRGGKFLKFDPTAHRWYEISNQQARLKASQALREKMNYATVSSPPTKTETM